MKATSNIGQSWKYISPVIVLAAFACGQAAQAQATQLLSGPLTLTQDYPGTAKSPSDPNPATIASPFSVATLDGTNLLTFSTNNGTDLTRLDASTDFSAFTPGTKLIETNDGAPNYDANAPLIITFQNPVTDFGLFAQNYLLDKEAFEFTVYANNMAVGTFDVGDYADPETGGIDNTQGNGATVYLGASYLPGITSVQIFSSSFIANNPPGNPDSTNDFLVGTDPPQVSTVPEPAPVVSFGVGILGLGVLAFAAKRRQANQSGLA